MKFRKSIFITLFLIATIFSGKVLASSFTIDNLNLREAQPELNLPKAYFRIGLEDTWRQINDTKNLSLSPIIIGIIDTGIDSNHPEFKGIKLGSTPAEALTDLGEIVNGILESHGTNVAGIIGANNISSTSPANYVFPHMNGVLSGVKALDYTLENRKFGKSIGILTTFSAIKKISELSNSGAQVINFSSSSLFNVLADVIFTYSFASHPSILFVVAAGNDNKDARLAVPANLSFLDNVISVGGTDLNDGKVPESNFGSAVNISAPGELVFSPTFFKEPFNLGSYEFFSGTSASAPMVTGVAGLIKAIKPDLSPAQIKDILVRNADLITTDKPIGGRLNALKAVCDLLVLNCAPTPTPTPTPSQFVQLTNTLSPVQNLPPNISKSGNKVAFLSNANIAGLNSAGKLSLFTMNSDGTGIVRIGPNLDFLPDSEFRPSLSSNGSKVAFAARALVSEPSAAFVSNSDGTGIRRLSPPDRNVERVIMSSDGSRIIYNVFPAFPAKPQIFIVNFDGSSEKMLVEGTGTSTTLQLSSSAISDDGSKIVFSFLRSLSIPSVPEDFVWKVGVINTDGTGFVKIVPDIGNYSIEPPAISGDGSRIAFTVITYPTSLFVANSDGNNLHLLLTGHDPFQGGLKFTADESRIALSFLANIFIVNVNDPSSRKQITDNPGFASFSPYINGDGTIIVFRSDADFTGENHDSNVEIFLTNVK